MSSAQPSYDNLICQPKVKEYKGFLTNNQIDTHFNKHHQSYHNYVINYLRSNKLSQENFTQVLQDNYNNNSQLSNNIQQLFNHNLLWESLISFDQPQHDNNLCFNKLDKQFNITEQLSKCNLFGSGWIWFVIDGKNLTITTTSNAELPTNNLNNIISTIDLWEHAYYLDYHSRRKDYIKNIIEYIDWNRIEKALNI